MHATRPWRWVGHVPALSALLVLAPSLQAQDAAPLRDGDEEALLRDEPCASDDLECHCQRDDSCWDLRFLSTGKRSLLGVTVSATASRVGASDRPDVGVLVTYRAERYRTRDGVSSHARIAGSLGGGTADTEGALDAAISFGARFAATPDSGPVLRAGPRLLLIGHDELRLTLFEPLAVYVGFQRGTGDVVFEAGLSGGLLAAGRYGVQQEAASLTGGLDLGSHVVAGFGWLRLFGRVAQVVPAPGAGGTAVGMLRLGACVYVPEPEAMALCADTLHLRAALPALDQKRRQSRAWYGGVTIALTP